VAAALGNQHPFADEFYSTRQASSDRARGSGMAGRGGGQAANRPAAGGVGGAGAADLTAIPDMGILKTLQEMGDGMKSQLNQLALRFNSTTGGAHDKDDSDLQDSESRPLTAVDYEVSQLRA
jgi:hypothetical protein